MEPPTARTRAARRWPARDDRRTLLVGCILALVLTILLSGGFDTPAAAMDEATLLVYPELILKGKLPYRDFETFYGPANLYALAAVSAIFGTDIVVERAVGLAYRLAVFGAIFCLARRWGLVAAVGCVLATALLILPTYLPAYAWMGGVMCGLWSLWLATSGRERWRLGCAGGLAAVALLYRPDLGPAVLLSAGPVWWALKAPERRAFALGFAGGLLPLAWLAVAAGVGPVLDNLFIYPVFHQSQGRRLPMSGAAPWLVALFFLHLAASLAVIATGARGLWKDRRNGRALRLLCAGIFALGLTHQAAQRFDVQHVLFGTFCSIGLLPLVLRDWLRASVRRAEELAPWVATVAALVLVSALAPRLPGMLVRSGLRGLEIEALRVPFFEFNGRTYPAMGDYLEARRCLETLQQRAAAGGRLFVGPADLRRTNYNDTFIYHLMPHLEPATYFLEMNPFSANRPGSRLAADVASADWLVLNRKWDAAEPGPASVNGPDAPLLVAQTQFELCAQHGTYGLFRKKASSHPPATTSVSADRP